MILFCHTISKSLCRRMLGSVPVKHLAVSFFFIALVPGCASDVGRRPRINEGTISYPFIADTRPLGRARPKTPFIIRSAVGASEYTVEIPDDASRYDIQIPLAEMRPAGSTSDAVSASSRESKPMNAGTTDKELVAALPSLSKNKPNETALMDAAFGVGSPEGPVQSPSYTLGMARVNDNFREKHFEIALVDLNNLIAFYPNSPKLLKMKGTLLIKTGNRDLAMKAWERALDLAPADVALKRSIALLNERITTEQTAQTSSSQTWAPAVAQSQLVVAPFVPPVVPLVSKTPPASQQRQALTQQGKSVSQQGQALTQQGKAATKQATATQRANSDRSQAADQQRALENAVAH